MPRLLIKRIFLLLTAHCLLLTAVLAQSSTATLSGTIEDENGAVIPSAAIAVVNEATSFKRTATTNESGSFVIPLLPPGEYTVLVEREGFTRVQLTNIVLNVGDQKAVQIQLKVGDVASTVEVRADANLIDTGGEVGTVIDRQFVGNIPLNGRSFQSLFELTPGVVLVSPGATGGGGDFSVNGQRTTSNYVTVDGVSANTGIRSSTTPGNTGSGQTAAYTAQGSTAGLVSVDALQEFRIQTSSYAAEFGHQPGGQISLVTRSGGNDFHGTAFDYVRNEAFDARNWFDNANNRPQPPFRQQLFGGTFSGPIYFPNFGDGGKRLYSGKNRTFFFFSYEGLRLLQPTSDEVLVPTLCLRGESGCPITHQAKEAYRPFLRAFPRPTGPDLFAPCNPNTDPDPTCSPIPGQAPNIGTKPTGFATFAASYSDSSQYDATAIRIDHAFKNLTFFGRFSRTPSHLSARSGITRVQVSNSNSTAVTGGTTWTISKSIVNDVRVNQTRQDSTGDFVLDDFGGAVPLQTFGFIGRSPETAQFLFAVSGGDTNLVLGVLSGQKQRQFQVVDNLIVNAGDHQLKFGADFRRLIPTMPDATTETLQTTVPRIRSGEATAYFITTTDRATHEAAFDNLSFYAQDTWKTTRRLTLTLGLRWEIVPPPHAVQGGEARTLDGLDDPRATNHLSVAPAGTPLWKTRYANFAPRFGASYLLFNKAGRELVVRGGAGIFYDLGVGNSASAFRGWPHIASVTYPITGSSCAPPLTFPLPACAVVEPIVGVDPPSGLSVMDRELELPRTYQWNISAEQSLGPNQTVTVSYVGAAGRKLLYQRRYTGLKISGIAYPAGRTTTLALQQNLGYSDYQALQMQFQRRLSRGFQALASYTYGHSRDNGSVNDAGFPTEAIDPTSLYADSLFDVRHNLTGAVTFHVPSFKDNPVLKAISKDWELDVIFRKRTGLPVTVTSQVAFPPLPGLILVPANTVEGQPFWIDDPGAPGGRRLNFDAFQNPATGTIGNLRRGDIRGFGVKQVDLSLSREFQLFENVRLKLRAEAFNIFNWPNFTSPGGIITSPTVFGRANSMLASSSGGAGGLSLSSSYQIGGPRSMQFAARLSF